MFAIDSSKYLCERMSKILVQDAVCVMLCVQDLGFCALCDDLCLCATASCCVKLCESNLGLLNVFLLV